MVSAAYYFKIRERIIAGKCPHILRQYNIIRSKAFYLDRVFILYLTIFSFHNVLLTDIIAG